jgi:WD40 repeat protein
MNAMARWLMTGVFICLPAIVEAAPQTKDGVDALGDPLPEGALMRYGSNRLRHSQPMVAAAFSPDGKLIASSSFDSFIRLWSTDDGKEVAHIKPLQPTPFTPRLLSFSPDGKTLLATDRANTLCAFKMADATLIWQERNALNPQALAWSQDGKQIVLCRLDGVVRVLDAATGKLEVECARQEQQLTAVAFAADGKEVVAVAGFTLRRFDAKTGKLLANTPFPANINRGVNLNYPRITFTADGRQLVFSDAASGFWIWSLEPNTAQKHSSPQATTGLAISISSDNRFVAMSMADGNVTVWGAASGKMLRSISAATVQSNAILSPDARMLAAFAANNRVLRVWDLADFRPIGPEQSIGELHGVLTLDAGKTIITASYQGQLIAWDAATGKAKDQFQNATGGFLSFGSTDDKAVRAFDVQQNKVLWSPGKKAELVPRAGIRAAIGNPHHYAANGEWIAMRENTGDIVIREFESGKDIKSFRVENRNLGFHTIQMTPDLRWLTAIDGGRAAWTWEVADGRLLPSCGPITFPIPTSVSPDGRLLVSMETNALMLWEIASGKERARVPRANTLAPKSLAVSRDHRLLLAGSHQGELVLFDVLDGKEIKRIAAHNGGIRSIAFVQSSNRFLTAGDDNSVLLWDADRLAGYLPIRASAAENVREWMNDLRSSNGNRVFAAILGLSSHPDATLKLIRTLAKPPVDETAKRIDTLIAQLDHPRFKVREDASRELAALGIEAKKALDEAIKKPASEDARLRMENLLKKIQGGSVTAESLREYRLIETLERIGTKEARDQLVEMTKGKAESPIVREAKAVLERWR